MHINDLPNELLLCVFPHLPLKSLIAAQGACRKWRQLIPLSHILPTRRALLELYLSVISSPVFSQSREWTLANLRGFNRQKYIDSLLQQHDYLPEAFRLWITEWPARAVIGCCWPGLPGERCYATEADGVDRLEGVNWLGYIPPQVSIMLRTHRENGPTSKEILPGLLVWSSAGHFVWLMLDEREGRGGRVYDLGQAVFIIRGVDSDGVDGDRAYDDEVDDDDDGDDDDDEYEDEDEDDAEETHVVYSNWVEWQRHLWKEIERAAQTPRNGSAWPGIDFTLLGRKKRRETLPVTAWTRRHETGYLDWLGPVPHAH